MDSTKIIEQTRRWIAEVVIGLNLCPFARRVFEAGAVRYVVSEARSEEDLLLDLERELTALQEAPIKKVETTLLIHPFVMQDFLDFNDFLELGEGMIFDLDLEGIVQLASFHPDYQFSDTPADAIENYTNRSPFPMLHLLREESVSAVAGDADELDAIPTRNIATLQSLGLEGIQAILRAISGNP